MGYLETNQVEIGEDTTLTDVLLQADVLLKQEQQAKMDAKASLRGRKNATKQQEGIPDDHHLGDPSVVGVEQAQTEWKQSGLSWFDESNESNGSLLQLGE